MSLRSTGMFLILLLVLSCEGSRQSEYTDALEISNETQNVEENCQYHEGLPVVLQEKCWPKQLKKESGYDVKLWPNSEVAFDLLTGVVSKGTSRQEKTCDEERKVLWSDGSGSELAWIKASVIGQMTCAGVFYMSTADSGHRRYRYWYAIHANSGVIERFPSDIIRQLGWNVKLNDLQVFYAPGESSVTNKGTDKAVADKGCQEELQKLRNDGVPPQNIHVILSDKRGASMSGISAIRDDKGWQYYWGAI